MTPRSLAAAQTVPTRGDVDANVADHLRLVHAAAERGAQVIVFPELSLTGYELDLARDLAFTARDPRLTPLVETASAHGTTLIVGAPVRLGPLLHIAAFVLPPDGSIALYTKRHLGAFPPEANPDGPVPPAEPTVFQPGTSDPLVHFHGHAAAVGICADTAHPSHPEEAARRGAQTYLASVFVLPSDLEEEHALLRTHAARHALAVVMANFGGPTGGLPSAGGSAIWSPTGERVARLEGEGAGLVLAHENDGDWRGEAAPRVL